MSTYTVHAKRWEHGWELHVDGVGVTQCRTLADADRMARDFIATLLDGEPEDYEVVILPDLGGLENDVAQVLIRNRQVADQTRQAAAESRRVARELRAAGLSATDMAVVLGVSRGRASQLAARTDEAA